MSSNAARQRSRRERLRRQGIVDVTVPVPLAARPQLRAFAQGLSRGRAPALNASRLLPALDALRECRADLAGRGVLRAGLFGSTARGLDGPDSDVDVIIHTDPASVGDVLDMVNTADLIAAAIQARCPGARVDVADRASLKPAVLAAVERDAVYAF